MMTPREQLNLEDHDSNQSQTMTVTACRLCITISKTKLIYTYQKTLVDQLVIMETLSCIKNGQLQKKGYMFQKSVAGLSSETEVGKLVKKTGICVRNPRLVGWFETDPTIIPWSIFRNSGW